MRMPVTGSPRKGACNVSTQGGGRTSIPGADLLSKGLDAGVVARTLLVSFMHHCANIISVQGGGEMAIHDAAAIDATAPAKKILDAPLHSRKSRIADSDAIDAATAAKKVMDAYPLFHKVMGCRGRRGEEEEEPLRQERGRRPTAPLR